MALVGGKIQIRTIYHLLWYYHLYSLLELSSHRRDYIMVHIDYHTQNIYISKCIIDFLIWLS